MESPLNYTSNNHSEELVVVVSNKTTHQRTVSIDEEVLKKRELLPEKRSPSCSDNEIEVDRKKKSSKKNKKTRKRSRSRSSERQHKKSRRRSSSSSSRGTFDGFEMIVEEEAAPPLTEDELYRCGECRRENFYSIKMSMQKGIKQELAEHEIRAHDARIPCALCAGRSESVASLASHMQSRHSSEDLLCHYCNESFGGPTSKLSSESWEVYRKHIYQEVLKNRMYVHASKASNGSSAVALRGIGRCPHGPPVKCKNFPKCPGAKCFYAHGLCRFDRTCNKSTCPFDHTNKPRTCMACINDMRGNGGGGRR